MSGTTSTDTTLTTIGFMQRIVEGWVAARDAHHQHRESYQHNFPVIFDRALREAALSGEECDAVAHSIVDWLLEIEDPDGLDDVLLDLTDILFKRLPYAARQGPELCTHDAPDRDGDCPDCVIEMFARTRARLLAPAKDD
jgi:hypothetical protein